MKYVFTVISLFIITGLNAQTIYYVDIDKADNTGSGNSWATAKKDFQEALDVAPAGSQVWVKTGTYYPTKDPFGNAAPADLKRRTFYIRDSVAVYGGFAGTETLLSQRNIAANPTTLSGDFNDDDSITGAGQNLTINMNAENAYHVVLHASDLGTTIDGLTISGGNATGFGQQISVNGFTVAHSHGGGLFSISTAGQLNIANCNFSYNATTGTGSGAGAYIASHAVITNCVFSYNSGDEGGGLTTRAKTVTISNNEFLHNRAGWGGGISTHNTQLEISGSYFSDNFGYGGGIRTNLNSKAVITNCIFDHNSASNSSGGAAICTADSSVLKSYFTAFVNNRTGGTGLSIRSESVDSLVLGNCIFANDSAANKAEVYMLRGKADVMNCSFTGYVFLNTTIQYAGFRNCVMYDFLVPSPISASLLAINCSILPRAGNPFPFPASSRINSITSDPLFVNPGNPAGPDGIFFTADDGLMLQCGSPAINSGSDTATVTDITGMTRLGKPDIGAYEAADTANEIASVSSSFRALQSNTTVYGDCEHIVARVAGWGAAPITDSTTARVWVEADTPATWVKRHYEIIPDSNASTASGRVTLYFSQAEFDAFNTLNLIKLPAGGSDAAGKANLLIEKQSGISSDDSGLPGTYSGLAVTVNPADSDIVWNNQHSRWEVTFNGSGFGGFFVKTTGTPLPLTWLSVTGRLNLQRQAVVSWRVAERGVASYDVELSRNGREFIRLATINGEGDGEHNYSFTDPDTRSSLRYYRVRQEDIDGRHSYSSIITISADAAPITAFLYPNPATTTVTLETGPELLGSAALLSDINGILVKHWVIRARLTSIDLSDLSPGIYILKLSNGQVLRVTRR